MKSHLFEFRGGDGVSSITLQIKSAAHQQTEEVVPHCKRLQELST